MPYWAKIIPLLLVLSAVIAYVADELGRRLGKKKVKLFGLRPKKTSVLIAVGSGVVTTGVVIIIMALLSENARIALWRVDELKLQARDLEVKTKELRFLLKNSKRVTAKARAAEKAAIKEEAIMRSHLDKEKTNAAMLSSELLLLKAEVHNTTGLRDKVQKELETSRKDIRRQKNEMKDLVLQKNKMDQQMGALTREYLKKEKENLALEKQTGKLKTELTRLHKTLESDRKNVLHTKVIFTEGQLLLRQSIGANERGGALVTTLEKYLAGVNNQVYEKGARYHGQQALLYYRPQIESLTSKMDVGRAYVLRVSSATNTFEGQPVVAKFELLEDKLVFFKGQVIVKRKVDAKKEAEESPETVLQEILIDGKRKALTSGLIPGPSGVGSLLASVMVETAQEMKNSPNSMEVSLVALKDIYRGSNLEVEFRLRSLQNP